MPIVQISLVKGRDEATLKRFVKTSPGRSTSRSAHTMPTIRVILHEVPAAHWAIVTRRETTSTPRRPARGRGAADMTPEQRSQAALSLRDAGGPASSSPRCGNLSDDRRRLGLRNPATQHRWSLQQGRRTVGCKIG